MRALVTAGVLIAAVFMPVAIVLCDFPATLNLERAFPSNHRIEMSQLRERDRVRHGRILQSTNGVVDFPVYGTYDPYLVGLYFARVLLGSPPKEYFVQIDTGSDVLWISCGTCNGCPTTSGLNIELNSYDPGSSSTASPISCSDQRCLLGAEWSDSGCSTENNQCSYLFQYGDGSGTSGYYVSDLFHMETVVGQSVNTNSSVPVVFGCSTSQTGDLTKPERAVDGIFGFGQQDMSVISQLASQGAAPRAFSHCLKGSGNGGGVLVLGEIVDPSIVYSPLVPSQPHYNLNLQSISVNGQTLNIDPSVFTTSSSQGTIVDSGTTLAYLAEAAYDPFVSAITSSLSTQSVRTFLNKGNQCFQLTSSVGEIFPPVSFNFAGSASMNLKPEDYLIQQPSSGGAAVWCIGFQKIEGQGVTILGDLVLKDKIFVYDLAGQRIGWANYDCSMSVNVSTSTSTGKSEFVNAGQLSESNSLQNVPYQLINLPSSAMAVLVMHTLLLLFHSFSFL